MATDGQVVVQRCTAHACCLRAPHVESEVSGLAGEWHLRWMDRDSAWFLVPPHGNVWEIRVPRGEDPGARLAVDGVRFDEIRETIAREGLSPPC
jgi:hypothetical protein